MNFIIDGKEIEALDGETVLQAAKRCGIEIPHFCYHDKLSVAGSCRICLVKVNGMPKLQPACNVVVGPKMTVETQTEDVVKARAQVMQFILLNHPVDCGICDKAGECTLQDNQVRYGSPESRSIDPKNHKRKLVALSPRISLDNERCILCSRCVRFTREISGSNALGIVDRGSHSYVERLGCKPFDDPYSDNVIGICPTGALLSTEFLYKSRVWFLEPVRSVCTGCSRGCSVQAWRRMKIRQPHMQGVEVKNEAYRISAFDNPEINGPWLCNKGFDMHQWMSRDRLLHPSLAGVPATVEAALAQACRLLSEARHPALLVSAQASNEELDAAKAALGERVRAYVRQDNRPAPGEVVEDQLLIKADKNPNTFGAQARFGAEVFDTAAGHDLVIVWGEWNPDVDGALGDARVVHLVTFGAAVGAKTDVVLPVSTTFERSGSFSNFEGKTNTFAQVFDKPSQVQHAAEVFRSLAP
jgi:NADH-quinone oxidoreductase subunit G